MVDGAVNAGTPAAAAPATGQAGRYAEMLAELTEMALELARAFQVRALAADRAGDLDRAVVAEAGFNRTALGIRRAVALDATLQRQREEVRHKTEDRRDRRRQEKDARRRAVGECLSRAIAAVPPGAVKPEVRERLPADLWSRLTEDERIDADLADTALPIETLILRLGRQLGLPRRAVAAGLGPKEKAGPARAAPKPWDEIPAARPVVAPAEPDEDLAMPPPLDENRTSSYHRSIAAEDVGGPEGETWVIDTINGEIFDQDWTLIRTLPKDDRPPDSGAAGPPAATAPPDPGGEPPGTAPPGEDADEAERRRLRRERDAEGRRAMMMAHIFRHA